MDINAIIAAKKFCKGGSSGASIPKPLTYDYMPEGYPKSIVENKTIIEECYPECVYATGYGEAYYTKTLWNSNPLIIVAGNTYEVSFDGVTYECVAEEFDSGGALGAAYNKDTGYDFSTYPFRIVSDRSTGTNWTVYSSQGQHTLSIRANVETVETIAEKFLPDSVKSSVLCCFRVYNDYMSTGDWSMVGTTYDELFEAYRSGRPICGMTAGAGNGGVYLYAVTEITFHSDEDGTSWCIITNILNEEFKYNPDGTIYPNGEY